MIYEKGFTLIEAMTTVAIVGVLAGAASLALKPTSSLSLEAAQVTSQSVAQLRKTIVQSNVTSTDVLAYNLENGSNFPPDARGTIDVEYVRTGQRIAQSVTIYTRMLTKVGGVMTLETVSEKKYPLGKIGLRKALAVFDHTGQAQNDPNAPLREPEPGGSKGQVTERVRGYCYANSTCDPLTYYFSGTELIGRAAKEINRARIAISTTGSIVVQSEPVVAPPGDKPPSK